MWILLGEEKKKLKSKRDIEASGASTFVDGCRLSAVPRVRFCEKEIGCVPSERDACVLGPAGSR